MMLVKIRKDVWANPETVEMVKNYEKDHNDIEFAVVHFVSGKTITIDKTTADKVAKMLVPDGTYIPPKK